MRSSYRSRAAVGVAALLLTFGVAGCEDADPADPIEPTGEPIPPHSSSPTEPTTTDTGPVEPTLPAEAEGETKEAVEAFVTFYWDVVNYATKTGEVGLLKALDQPSCEGCDGGIRGIARVYRAGGQIVGGDYEVVRVEAYESKSGNWTVDAHTTVGRQRAIGAGDLNTNFPPGRDKWLIGLARVRGAWSVTTLESSE